KGVGMIACPGRAPDCRARDIEAHRHFRKLRSDSLMLDEATPSLHAQLRIVERGFTGGTADPEIDCLLQRAAEGFAGVFAAIQKFSRRYRAIFEYQFAAHAMVPAARLIDVVYAQSARVMCYQKHRHVVRISTRLDSEQLCEWRVCDAILATVDDKSIA